MPASSSSWTSRGPSCMLKMITRDRGETSPSLRTVAVASPPGISTSSSTTSGRSRAAVAIASALSPASPTTSMSSCAWRILRSPSRTSM